MGNIWSTRDKKSDRKSQTFGYQPEEIALTATAIFYKYEPQLKVMLCNPSPEKWNSWMFPYGSQKHRASPGTNMEILSHFQIEELVGNLGGASDEKLQSRKKQLFQSLQCSEEVELAELDTVYECKVSKTSNLLTLYVFEYYSALVNEGLTPEMEHSWMTLDDASSYDDNLQAFSQATGMVVEKNVFEIMGVFSKHVEKMN